MYAKVAHSTRGSINNKKVQMSNNYASRGAKRMKLSEVIMCIGPFFQSSYVFPLQKCDDIVNEKKLNYESERVNPISPKEQCLKIADIRGTFHLEYSSNEI